jgi:hypothetical protein
MNMISRGLPLTILLLITFSAAALCASAVVETNTGSVFQGDLAGIAPVIRLDVSPGQAFFIPLAEVKQITVDFPRVIVETGTRVYIGPYSLFSGIDETMTTERRTDKHEFAFASLRAIALNGETIHQVPRTWLTDEFLSPPVILSVSPSKEAQLAVSTPQVVTDTTPQTWDDLYQPVVPPAEEAQTPWWLLALVVAGIALVIFLSM